MADIGAWEDAEPGVRRRILQAQGGLMLMEVQISHCVTGRFEYSLDGRTHLLTAGGSIYVPSNARHGAKALEPGTPCRATPVTARRLWSQAHLSMCSPPC